MSFALHPCGGDTVIATVDGIRDGNEHAVQLVHSRVLRAVVQGFYRIAALHHPIEGLVPLCAECGGLYPCETAAVVIACEELHP